MPRFPIVTEAITTHARSEMIDVTPRIEKLLKRQAVDEGYVIVFVPHTTAAVTINEDADPDVKSDMLAKLQKLIPSSESFYQHAEGNSDSHVKTSLVGNSVLVLVERGKLQLGQWQGVYFCEFDGPRAREMFIKIIDLSAG